MEPAPQAPVESVRPGLFFAPPEALPRGRHNLSRERVRVAQRERLLIAMTELLASRGYRGFGPGDIARRASVSLAAFYDCFENKDACIFAGYDRFSEVLLRRLASSDVDGKDSPEVVKALLAAYLETLQSDPVVARAFQVEMDALGSPARERRRHALTLFATFLRDVATRRGLGRGELPWTAFLGVVYAARQLAADALEAESEPDLAGLGDDMQLWLADLFRGR